MAKPNYAFAKRQRDLAKKQKKEEKKLRKTGPGTEGGDPAADPADDAGGEVAEAGVDAVRGQGSLATEQATPLGGEPSGGNRQSGQA